MSTIVKPPLQSGSLRTMGLIWSVLFVAIGAIAIRDALVIKNVIGGTSWVAPALRKLDRLQEGSWLLGVAAVAVVLALVVLVSSLRPRRRVDLPLESSDSVFLAPRAASTIALAHARQADGVLKASVKRSRKKLDVIATTTSTDPAIKVRVQEDVERSLAEVANKPKLKVRLRQQKVDV